MLYIKFSIKATIFDTNLLQNCWNSNLRTPFRGRVHSTYSVVCVYFALEIIIKSNSTNLIRRLDIKATNYAWLLLPIKKKLAAIGYYTFTSFTRPLVWLITRLTNTFIVGIFFNGDAYLKKKIILCEQLCFSLVFCALGHSMQLRFIYETIYKKHISIYR